jgi:acyl-CoA thioester hydrolase
MTKLIETYRGVAYPWHCDSMGHMNTQFYSALYDGASFHFLSRLAPYSELEPLGLGWADVKQVIEYKHEIRSGSLLIVHTSMTRTGNKSVEYRHHLSNVETNELHSTSDQVTVLFDLKERRAALLSELIRQRTVELVSKSA